MPVVLLWVQTRTVSPIYVPVSSVSDGPACSMRRLLQREMIFSAKIGDGGGTQSPECPVEREVATTCNEKTMYDRILRFVNCTACLKLGKSICLPILSI